MDYIASGTRRDTSLHHIIQTQGRTTVALSGLDGYNAGRHPWSPCSPNALLRFLERHILSVKSEHRLSMRSNRWRPCGRTPNNTPTQRN